MTRTGFVCHEHYFWHHTGASAGPLPYGLTVQPDAHPESPETKRRLLSLLDVAGVLGYSTAYVPFCGLAAIEEMTGVRSEISDPFLFIFETMGGQALQPHQAAVIDAAARLAARVPNGT